MTTEIAPATMITGTSRALGSIGTSQIPKAQVPKNSSKKNQTAPGQGRPPK
jgi:hypothetical protein